MLSAFLLNIAIVRALGPAGSGSFFYVINTFALLLLLASCSLESGLGYYTARQELSPAAATGLSMVWSAGTATVLLFFLPLAGIALHLPEGYLFCWLYLSGSLLIVFFSALFQAKQDFVRPGIAISLLNVLLILLIWLTPEPDLGSHETAQVFKQYTVVIFGQGLFLAGLFTYKYVQAKGILMPTGAAITRLFRYAGQAFLSNLLFFLVYRVDYWLVKALHTDDALLGNYIQASKLGQLFFIVPGIIATTVFSVTASAARKAMHEPVAQLSRLIFAVVAMGLIFLLLTGYWLFPVLFGAGFTQMYLPFVWLTPGIIAIAVLYPYTAFYAGRNEIGVNIRGALLALPVIVGLDLLLIPRWQITGAAIASSAGYIVYQCWIMRRFTRSHAIAWRDCFWPTKKDRLLISRSLMNLYK